jgi:putative oxidoreductase
VRNSINADYHLNLDYTLLVSRILLSVLFIWSGVGKILDPLGTQQYMAARGMPLTGLFLAAAIALELVGGLSILLGYRSRWGTAALMLFLVPATLIFHTDFADRIQQIMFMKNLAIFGGLLMLLEFGSGQIAIRRD